MCWKKDMKVMTFMIPKLIKRIIFLGVGTLLFPLMAFGAGGATLSLSPSAGTYRVGDEIRVVLMLNTNNVQTNAVEATIKYLADELQVTGIDTSASIVSSWTIEPDYKTEDGVIRLGGIIPDGYKGEQGEVLRITLKAKKSGEARMRIATGAAVLVSDGSGTNILSELKGATFSLQQSVSAKMQETILAQSFIRSNTHPDPNSWYASHEVTFNWNPSSDTDSARFGVDQNPEGQPSLAISGNTTSRASILEDGVWYAHLALHDDGGWSAVGHLRIQIDSIKPTSLLATLVPVTDETNPTPQIAVEGTDEGSGIAKYGFTIDGGEEIKWADDGNHRYQLSRLTPGSHVITVRAYDYAGNAIVETLPVSITALPTVQFIDTPVRGSVGSEVIIKGKGVSDGSVHLSFSKDGASPEIEEMRTGSDGTFTYGFVPKEGGIYQVSGIAIDARGATSNPSPQFSINVGSSPLLGAIGATGVGGGFFSTLLLAIGLAIIFSYTWLRFGRGTTGLAYAQLRGRRNVITREEVFSENIPDTQSVESPTWGSIIRERLFFWKKEKPIETFDDSGIYSYEVAQIPDMVEETEGIADEELIQHSHSISLRQTDDNFSSVIHTPVDLTRRKEAAPHSPTVLRRR